MTMTALACSTCGGALPEALYCRSVACTYCSATQPNPACLRVDDEVLVSGGAGLELTRVTRCEGPDAITVAHGTVLHLEDVIPVARATDALESGTGVYVRGITWSFTYTSSRVHDGKLKVKHESAGFQDSFFDRDAMLEDIRLDARPPALGGRRGKRSGFGALAARFRESPGEMLFDVGTKLFIAIVFAIVMAGVLRAFVF
jgi:hypothetical protein